jgi:hypothetical protein
MNGNQKKSKKKKDNANPTLVSTSDWLDRLPIICTHIVTYAIILWHDGIIGDWQVELTYYQHGGILHYVLRQLI